VDDTASPPDRIAVVLAGGDPAPPPLLGELPRPALVIAADGGLEQAENLGRNVDIVVGDMDSVGPELLERARTAGAEIERYSRDKDATDLELALDRAVASDCSRVIVVGGDGGRLDHLLGNALVLTRDAYKSTAIEWWTGLDRVVVVHPGNSFLLTGRAGDVVSLLPIGGRAEGVRTQGLRWTLTDESLQPGSTRGVSNEMSGTEASVSLRGGVLLAIHRRREEVP
jgi:thiamine pyrophosphokinase